MCPSRRAGIIHGTPTIHRTCRQAQTYKLQVDLPNTALQCTQLVWGIKSSHTTSGVSSLLRSCTVSLAFCCLLALISELSLSVVRMAAVGGAATAGPAQSYLLVREQRRVVLMTAPSATSIAPRVVKVVADGEFAVSECSQDGRLAVLASDEDGVQVVSLDGKCSTLCTLDHKEVKKAGFSPSGAFVCTMHRKIDSRRELCPHGCPCLRRRPGNDITP